MYIIKSKKGYQRLVPNVEIEEYFSEDYFIGRSTKQGKHIFPVWRKALKTIFSKKRGKDLIEVIATGAIGSGKSTLAIIGSSFILYKLLLLEDPHDTFDMIRGQPIFYLFFNVTMDASEEGNILALGNLIHEAPVFRDLGVRFSKNTKYPKPIFPKNILLAPGSMFAKGFGAVGKNVISGMMDEVNESDTDKKQRKALFTQKRALKMYKAIIRRMKSRFFDDPDQPFLRYIKLFLISSRQEKDNFLEDYIEKVKDKKHVIVFDFPVWVARSKKKLCGDTFHVAVSPFMDPMIVKKKKEIPDVDGIKSYEIPVEYLPAFELDALSALAEIAGVSVNRMRTRFFRNRKLLKASFTERPINRDILELSLYDAIQVASCFNIKELMKLRGQAMTVHIDVGLTGDRLGIGAAMVESFKHLTVSPDEEEKLRLLKTTLDQESDSPVDEKKPNEVHVPIVLVPFALGIQAKDEIPLFKIRDFLFFLRDDIGIHFIEVTTDGYQSRDLRQLLTVANIPNRELSVDRTMSHHTIYRTWVYMGLVKKVKNRMLWKEEKELLELMTDAKIDHPDGGSKDLSDGVTGAVANLLIQKQSRMNMSPQARKDLYRMMLNQGRSKTTGLMDMMRPKRGGNPLNYKK